MKVLVVVNPFHDYARGSVIADKQTQDKLAESHPGHVVWAEHEDSKQYDLPVT